MERGHYIDISNTAYFRHDYDGEHADMRRLYEQAKIDQWNAATAAFVRMGAGHGVPRPPRGVIRCKSCQMSGVAAGRLASIPSKTDQAHRFYRRNLNRVVATISEGRRGTGAATDFGRVSARC